MYKSNWEYVNGRNYRTSDWCGSHSSSFVLQSTPLHLAAGYNRVRIVQLLLQHGADVHAKDKGYVKLIDLLPVCSTGFVLVKI